MLSQVSGSDDFIDTAFVDSEQLKNGENVGFGCHAHQAQ